MIGRNGTGKTRFGAWVLANSSIDRRPWVVIDFKGEELFRRIGKDKITRIDPSSRAPTRPGLYLLRPRLDQKDDVDDFLWRCWEVCNRQSDRGSPGGIGIFADEGMMLPKDGALQTILVQGRSLKMPRIMLVQRPVRVAREVFSEANFYCIFRLNDKRDKKVLDEFLPEDIAYGESEQYHSLWYDVDRDAIFQLTPCPSDEHIIAKIRSRAAVSWWRS